MEDGQRTIKHLAEEHRRFGELNLPQLLVLSMHHGGYVRILTALDSYVTKAYGAKYREAALQSIIDAATFTDGLPGVKDSQWGNQCKEEGSKRAAPHLRTLIVHVCSIATEIMSQNRLALCAHLACSPGAQKKDQSDDG